MDALSKNIPLWAYPSLLGLDMVIFIIIWALALCIQNDVTIIPVSPFLLLALGAWSLSLFCKRKYCNAPYLSQQSPISHYYINKHFKGFTWGMYLAICLCLYLVFYVLPTICFLLLLLPVLLSCVYILLYKPLTTFSFLPFRSILLNITVACGVSLGMSIPLGIGSLDYHLWQFSLPSFLLIVLIFLVRTWHVSWIIIRLANLQKNNNRSIDCFWRNMFIFYLLCIAFIFAKNDAYHSEAWCFYSLLSSSFLLIIFSYFRRNLPEPIAYSLSWVLMWAPLLVITACF